MSEEIIKMLLEQLKEKDRRIQELERQVEELRQSSSRESIAQGVLEKLADNQELSEDVKAKVDRAAELVIKHGRTLPYIQG